MGKRIILIGANSAVAQEIFAKLAHKNIVLTAGRKQCDFFCDVTQPINFPNTADVVLNCAASFGGQLNEDFENAVQTNVLGLMRICEASKRARIRHIVHISTIFTLLDASSANYSLYAITKKHGDELAAWYCKQHDIALTTLHPSRIYGDNHTFAKHQPFLYTIAKKSLAGEDIALHGSNDATRNYIHCSDLSEIVQRVIARCIAGSFCCVHPLNSTYTRIANAAQLHAGRGGKVYFLPDKPAIPDDNFPLDTSLYDIIGYVPSISIETGIEKIIDNFANTIP